MGRQTNTRESTKEQLLEAGIQIMLLKGYNNTGIMEVLQSTGVPKGSFYYYFESKEDFGLQIINHFNRTYAEKLRGYLTDQSLTPVLRLRKYCEESQKHLEAQDCKKGCLIGNLSQEMADQSEVLRSRLEEVLSEWRKAFAACIAEGQSAGEICQAFDPEELSEFFLCGWEGAVMRSKTTKNTGPQRAFMKVVFDHVLKA